MSNFSVGSSVCSSIDIWRSCRFIGALMRSLCLLPGGLGRFVPCCIGANHCRLRLIGWEKCGHGLTSRPRESASEPFLNDLLSLFRYPSGSWRALLAGTLPLRCCATRFACKTFTWRLPDTSHVVDLVFAHNGDVGEVFAGGVCQEVRWVRDSGPGRKRIRLNMKKPAHLAGLEVQSRPHIGRDCIQLTISCDNCVGVRRRGEGWISPWKRHCRRHLVD